MAASHTVIRFQWRFPSMAALFHSIPFFHELQSSPFPALPDIFPSAHDWEAPAL
jgi:hypothetical protein